MTGSKSDKAEPRGLTRIAGSILQLHRTKLGLSQDEAATYLGCSKTTWYRAESGASRLGFFRTRIGPIAAKLHVDAESLLLLLNGLWIDELLAAVRVASTSSDAHRNSAAFPMLKWLWYDAQARTWLKLLLMKDPSPWLDEWPELAPVPCLARHPALKRFVRRNLRRTDAQRSSKGGAARETLWDALGDPLMINSTSLHVLRQAVFGAQRDAIGALRQPPDASPAVGDMLLLFADVAAGDGSAASHLLRDLRSVSDESLHPIDRRYRARALYLLGDRPPLCAVVESTFATPERSVLRYYTERSGSDDRNGTQTLADLCSKLEFAFSRHSIPLLALYLGTTLQLVSRLTTERGWSLPLGNFSTSVRLAALLELVTKWLDTDNNSGRRRSVRHDCGIAPGCFLRARTAARELQTAIMRARAALRAADAEDRLRADPVPSAGAATTATLRGDRP